MQRSKDFGEVICCVWFTASISSDPRNSAHFLALQTSTGAEDIAAWSDDRRISSDYDRRKLAISGAHFLPTTDNLRPGLLR